MATLRELVRDERSRLDRRGALITVLTGLAIAGLGRQIRDEREQIEERYQRRRHYATRRSHPQA